MVLWCGDSLLIHLKTSNVEMSHHSTREEYLRLFVCMTMCGGQNFAQRLLSRHQLYSVLFRFNFVSNGFLLTIFRRKKITQMKQLLVRC